MELEEKIKELNLDVEACKKIIFEISKSAPKELNHTVLSDLLQSTIYDEFRKINNPKQAGYIQNDLTLTPEQLKDISKEASNKFLNYIK